MESAESVKVTYVLIDLIKKTTGQHSRSVVSQTSISMDDFSDWLKGKKIPSGAELHSILSVAGIEPNAFIAQVCNLCGKTVGKEIASMLNTSGKVSVPRPDEISKKETHKEKSMIIEIGNSEENVVNDCAKEIAPVNVSESTTEVESTDNSAVPEPKMKRTRKKASSADVVRQEATPAPIKVQEMPDSEIKLSAAAQKKLKTFVGATKEQTLTASALAQALTVKTEKIAESLQKQIAGYNDVLLTLCSGQNNAVKDNTDNLPANIKKLLNAAQNASDDGIELAITVLKKFQSTHQ